MSCSRNLEDMISILPEEILSQILSLMPTKCAAQTSVLSKTWRYKWMLITNLEFGDIYPLKFYSNFRGKHMEMELYVDEVMELISPPIRLFQLRYMNSCVPESCVLRWIDRAVGLGVRELDIDVLMFELPLSMFTCKTLTRLRLNCSIYDTSSWECPSSVYLPCLKTLEINVFKNPFVNAFRLIDGCPVLESLSFEVAWFRKHEHYYIFNIPTLKRLKLTLPYQNSVINYVVLNVPNLEYLFVGGSLCALFVMGDVSSLVEACVSFNETGSPHHHLYEVLLKGLNGVESLSVQNVLIELHLPLFRDMKHLELKSFTHSGPVIQLLKSCPNLKHLYIEETHALAWSEWILAPGCMLTSLTTIKFSMSMSWRYDIPFLRYLLQNAEVLKKVTITWKYANDINQEINLCATVLSLPRASTCCEIHFRGNWSHSTSS